MSGDRWKRADEIERDDWFLTTYPDERRYVSWIAQSDAEDFGGSVGWVIRAYPLEDPNGLPWPEGLSREEQPVRIADIHIVLDRVPDGAPS